MTTRTIHLCQSVEGALLNWDEKLWKSLGKDNDKTAREMKQAFINYIREGKEVIPLGECDNFCYKEGCRGHVKEENNLDGLADD